jgi:large subunit ribosomal protein L10
MQKQEKERLVNELTDQLRDTSLLVLSNFQGINVQEMNRLRRLVQKSNGYFRVVKNTLIKRALSKSGFLGLDPLLSGPTAIFYTDQQDPSVLSKTILAFLKERPEFSVKGLAFEKAALKSEMLKDLSELPSREQLLSQLVGVLNSLPTRFLQSINCIPQKLVLSIAALEKVKA